MADTGPPWNLRFPGPQDFVRETNFYIEDLAEDVAAGLSAAGGLVAVKHVLKTDTFVSGSISGGGNVAVDDLEITHEVADVGNRLIITAYFGVAASSSGSGECGIAINEEDGAVNTLLAVGDGLASRTRVSSGGQVSASGTTQVVAFPSVTFVHTPTAGEKTYSVLAVAVSTASATLYVNRNQLDSNTVSQPRGVSALIIQEVKV